MRGVLFTCALLVLPSFAEDVSRGGDFTDAGEDLAGVAFANGGKVSLYTERGTWNRCGMLEVLAPTTNIDGSVTWNAAALVGSSDGKSRGIKVVPGREYDFSVELRGDKSGFRASVNAFTWDAGPWKDGMKIKTTVSPVAIAEAWTLVKGSFKVPDGRTRAALCLGLWPSTECSPVRIKEGDCLYFDNVSVQESSDGFATLGAAPAKADAAVAPRRAIALGETAGDFFVFRRGVGATMPTKAVSARMNIDEDAFVVSCEAKLADEPRLGKSDDVWSGDAMEIFIGGGAERPVRQFAWNASGAIFPKNNAKDVVVKSEVANGIWRSQARIPLASAGFTETPDDGETVSFNIVYNGGPKGLMATWAPVVEGFKDEKHFGVLVFGSYADAVKRRFGEAVDSSLDRAGYEKRVAELEAAARQKELERVAGMGFTVSVVPVDSDFSCPFVPRESFHPANEISLKGAVNEKVGLPVAILNLTDAVETYVVRIETDTADSLKPWAEKQNNGTWGLKGFPEAKITAREALRFKDTDNGPVTTRLEMLPKMNEACTIIVPPKEAGLVWFDFDCDGVAPATYKGRLRVIPLSQPSKFVNAGKSYHNRIYDGKMQDVPVSLEVRPIILDKEPAQPLGFFQNATTEGQFELMADMGTRDFQVSPWSFSWAVDGSGRTYDFSRPGAGVSKAGASVKKTLELAKRRGFRPTFFIGFNAYPVFCGLSGCKGDAEKELTLWTQWLKGVKNCMNLWGVDDADYVVEVFDEPSPSKFAEIEKALEAAKRAVGSVRLLITLGAHVMSADDMRRLDPYINGWVLWSHGYFSRPEHLAYVKESLATGKTVWHYTCGTSARMPIYETYRLHPWFGWRHGLSGNQFFIFQEQEGGFGLVDFKKAAASGIAYRSFDSTMPSLRYMSMRRGVEDLKYLAKLHEVAGEKPEVVSFLSDAAVRVVETERHDKTTPDRMREKAAELILKYSNEKNRHE